MDVFRSTWEAERSEHAEAGAVQGSYRVYCIVCDTPSDHPAGAAYFIRMPDGDVQ